MTLWPTSHSGRPVRRTGEGRARRRPAPHDRHPQPLDAVMDEGAQLLNVAYRLSARWSRPRTPCRRPYPAGTRWRRTSGTPSTPRGLADEGRQPDRRLPRQGHLPGRRFRHRAPGGGPTASAPAPDELTSLVTLANPMAGGPPGAGGDGQTDLTTRATCSRATTTPQPVRRPEVSERTTLTGRDTAPGASRWRWRWDLNPRWACTHTRFRGVLLRPLGHATAGKATGPLGADRNQRGTGRAERPTAANIRRARARADRGADDQEPVRRTVRTGERGVRRGASDECPLARPRRAPKHQAVAGEPVPPRQLEPLPLDPRGDAEAGRRRAAPSTRVSRRAIPTEHPRPETTPTRPRPWSCGSGDEGLVRRRRTAGPPRHRR